MRRAAWRLGVAAALAGAAWLLWAPGAAAQDTPRVWFVDQSSSHHEHDDGNIVETFTATNSQGKVFEYRLSEHEVVVAVDPAPTQDLYVRFRYESSAEWFRRTFRSVSLGDYTGTMATGRHSSKEITTPLSETHPWTGDYYVAHDGAPEHRCWGLTEGHPHHLNCGAVNGRVWTAFKIPAGTTRHTLKIRVVDDDVHDSGETVRLVLGQGWHRIAVRGDNLGAPTGNKYRGCWRRVIINSWPDLEYDFVWDERHCHESVPYRVTGTGYTLGPNPTHTLTILNDEPPPEPEPEAEPWVPPPPDLDAPAPDEAAAEVLWDRSVLVGWPSADGVSKYHVRARSGDGHGTRWGYNQTGNWYVFGGLQTGTWIIEVYDAGRWTAVTGWMIVKMPEEGQEPDPPAPPAQTTTQPAQPKQTTQPKQPPPTPAVSIAAGPAVTEGAAATFTVTASPAPAAALTVSLSVSQSGDYAAVGTTGTRTVTVPTSGSATYSVATVDDGADEADGSVTVAVAGGSGYTVGSSSSATVAVSDNDDPPQPEQPPPTPAVSISAGGGITEGGTATFTVTASPAPQSSLTVSLSVSESGDYAAVGTTGTRTVTVPASGSATYSVATVDDGADEADGSVTVAVAGGSGYTVASSSSATVAVSDNDDPPQPEQPQPEPEQPQPQPEPQPVVCVTADAALMSQVAAKVARHASETGRSDLHEMFSRSHATMSGDDTYTTAALKARPDKQGAKWQGAGPNLIWQAVYAELDRLEACRTGQ